MRNSEFGIRFLDDWASFEEELPRSGALLGTLRTLVRSIFKACSIMQQYFAAVATRVSEMIIASGQWLEQVTTLLTTVPSTCTCFGYWASRTRSHANTNGIIWEATVTTWTNTLPLLPVQGHHLAVLSRSPCPVPLKTVDGKVGYGCPTTVEDCRQATLHDLGRECDGIGRMRWHRPGLSVFRGIFRLRRTLAQRACRVGSYLRSHDPTSRSCMGHRWW